MPPPDDKQIWLGKLGVNFRDRGLGGSEVKLRLLSPGDISACEKYLAQHFDIVPKTGATGSRPDDYQPALDGKPVIVFDVVQALMPLTLMGSSTLPALAESRSRIVSELTDLVQARYDRMVAAKTAGGDASGTSNPTPERPAPTTGEQAWSIDLSFNANKSLFGGTAPPPYQAQGSLKWNALSIPIGELGKWKFSTLDQPSVSLQCTTKGSCSDQEAADLITAKWMDIEKNAKLTATLQGFVNNLATMAPIAGGAQLQVELRISSAIGVQMSATGTGDRSGFNVSLGLSGVLHLEAVSK
jgi:hypothetical protein